MKSSMIKFTKYYHISRVNDEYYYLLHTLVGSLDLISKEEKKIIDRWTESNLTITPQNSFEQTLYNSLIKRKYILTAEIEESLFNNAKDMTKSIEQPPIVTFILSYNCNFKCPYCFEKKHQNSSNIMSEEMVDKIFSLNKNHIDHICFYGGEPFLPEHYDIIKYIITKSPKSHFSAITNGYNVDLFMNLLTAIKIDFLQITLDGPEQIHDSLRKLKNNSNTYHKILENINKLLELNIPVKVRMNISPKNISECLKLREELQSMHKNRPLFFELQPIFQLSHRETKRLQNKIHESDTDKDSHLLTADSIKKNIIINTYHPLLKYISSSCSYFKPIMHNCDAETRRIIYDADGLFYSCLVSVGNQRAACGKYFPNYSVRKDSLLSRSIFTIKQCQSCKYAFICGGGCGFYSIDETGNSLHPNCSAAYDLLNNDLPIFIKRKFSNYFQS